MSLVLLHRCARKTVNPESVAAFSSQSCPGSNNVLCPSFFNKNPRNLERLRIAYKCEGYSLEKPGRNFWHKFIPICVQAFSLCLPVNTLNMVQESPIRAACTAQCNLPDLSILTMSWDDYITIGVTHLRVHPVVPLHYAIRQTECHDGKVRAQWLPSPSVVV
uniref:Uncharacterized protein n=1 Tax=Timema tahoe TaxID=61484 RepID=A0A7R9IFR3_9NEOP|nr:unnamed protein product [Timema tahoe]